MSNRPALRGINEEWWLTSEFLRDLGGLSSAYSAVKGGCSCGKSKDFSRGVRGEKAAEFAERIKLERIGMTSSSRISTLRSIGRYAAYLVCLALFAASGWVPNAGAQTNAADAQQWKRWLDCDVNRISGDHDRRSSNFTVRVSFREAPISGVRVSLVSENTEAWGGGRIVATGETDSSGDAHFFAIPRGLYRADVAEALLASSAQIEVAGANTSADEVGIEWPSSPIVTRGLRGLLTSWQKSSPQNRSERLPLQNVLVQLLDLRSAKLLAITHTGPDGDYEFSVRDGLYVVRVSRGEDPSSYAYDVAVEVASSAKIEHMPALEVDNGCGSGLLLLADEAQEGSASLPADGAGSGR
jgi:hypothetical protein